MAQYANFSWVLTDYTRDNGAVCVVPGSHLRGHPVPEERVMAHDHEDVEVLEMPAGSLIVWHGSLWHGALPRKASGRRVTLVLPCCRDANQTQEIYWATTTPEMIDRNPRRFCTLMGLTSAYPWLYEGVDHTLQANAPRTGSPFE